MVGDVLLVLDLRTHLVLATLEVDRVQKVADVATACERGAFGLVFASTHLWLILLSRRDGRIILLGDEGPRCLLLLKSRVFLRHCADLVIGNLDMVVTVSALDNDTSVGLTSLISEILLLNSRDPSTHVLHAVPPCLVLQGCRFGLGRTLQFAQFV